MKYQISNVGLLVPNVQRAVPFYRDKFGYTLKQDFPEFAEFNADEATLFLWQWSHLAEHLGEDAMSKVKHRFMGAIQCDTAEEVDAAYDELQSKGVTFLAEPTDWPWQARAAYFVDEEGYMWELYAWID